MSKQILIADDSPDDQALFMRALARAGIETAIQTVEDGEEAIQYLRGEGAFSDRNKYPLPQVLCLDIHMPRKNGIEVLRWLRTQSELRGVVVVMLAGERDLKFVREAYTLGAYSFLTKPVDRAEISLIQEALLKAPQ